MAEKKKIINQDGKQYEFTPGENGSLFIKGQRMNEPTLDLNPIQQAKAVPMAPGLSELAMYLDPNRKLRGGI